MVDLIDWWNPSWKGLPWKTWTSPIERYQVLPSFVIGEFFFIFCAILLFIHAAKHGRVYLTLWFSSLLTGSANDAFFMALPIVDNFWQSQACIMLTPRMPLYIPCVYVVFMYPSLIGSWRFKLPTLAQAALAGLMGEMIYAPYDITGAKFLWWTWHDTDAPIRDRLFGAPIGSSTWVMTFCCSFQLIWRLMLTEDQVKDGGKNLSLESALLKLGTSAVFSTPLMVLQMAFFQLISGDIQGLPTAQSMVACISAYSLLIYSLPLDKSDGKNLLHRLKSVDEIIRVLLTVYFMFLVGNMIVSTPENHMSSGIHQTVGDCKIFQNDLAGHQRQEYLCQEKFDEDFNFECPHFEDFESKDLIFGTEWYTVCGNSHTNKFVYLMVVWILGMMGTFTYRIAFAQRYEKSKIN